MAFLRKINLTPQITIDTSLRWNISNSTFIPVAVMFPLIVFVCMSLADVEYSLLSYATFASLLLGFAFMALVYLRERTMSRYGILSFVFFMIFIVFSLVNFENSDLKESIYMSIEIWLFQLLFFYYRERIHVVVIAAAVFLSFCVYANFLHLLMHPALWIVEEEKTALGYLLGNNYNGMGFRMILAVTFSFLCMKYSWKWIFNAILVLVLSIVPLVLTGSKTSLGGIVLFVLIICIPNLRLQKYMLNGLLTLVVLFQIFVVFSGKGLENNEFAVYMIEDVMEKDITFTGRTYLWDMSLDKIAESPIWGFGYLNYDWYVKNIHTSIGTGPCNMILAVILHGGIILLSLFVSIFVISIRKVMAYTERYALIIQAGLTTIMLMHLMENLSYVFCFYLMTLAYYYPFIRKEVLIKEKITK